MYMILQEQPYFPEDNPTIKMDYNQIQDNEISQHYSGVCVDNFSVCNGHHGKIQVIQRY